MKPWNISSLIRVTKQASTVYLILNFNITFVEIKFLLLLISSRQKYWVFSVSVEAIEILIRPFLIYIFFTYVVIYFVTLIRLMQLLSKLIIIFPGNFPLTTTITKLLHNPTNSFLHFLNFCWHHISSLRKPFTRNTLQKSASLNQPSPRIKFPIALTSDT